MPCLHFGSIFMERCLDAFPASSFGRVRNRHVFAGVLAFDKWTANTRRRQAVFVRGPDKSCEAEFIASGACFNCGAWNFAANPPDGAFLPYLSYLKIRGWEAFEPWLTRIETLPESLLFRLAA